MGESAGPVPIESLLAHAGWLRALALSLVGDSQAADDVVQETWLVALRQPPRKKAGVRAWLGTVARNVVRMEGRSEGARRRREERGPTLAGLPDPSVLVERIELQQRLARLVTELDEPERTTVLLRYYEGMRPHEIAIRSGVPASIVRGRLQRGLASLRGVLDAANGGDRAAWTLALLPLAGLDLTARSTATGSGIGLVTGGLIMSAKVKLGLAVSILLVLAFALWQVVGTPEAPGIGPEEERASAEFTLEPTGLEDPGEPPAKEPPGRAAVGSVEDAAGMSSNGSPGAVAPELAAGPRPAAGVVVGRVVSATGADLAGAEVTVREIIGRKDAAVREAVEITPAIEPDGTFRVEGLAPGPYAVSVRHPRLAASSAVAEVTTGAGAAPIELVLGIAGALVVSVLDASGQPLADQTIRISGPDGRTGQTDAAGEMRLERLPPGSYDVRWNAPTQGVKRVVAVLPGETARLVFRRGAVLAGTVRGPDGKAPETALVRLRPVKYGPQGYEAFQAYTRSGGIYRITDVPPGEYVVDVQVLKPESYAATTGKVTLAPGEEKTHDIWVRATILSGRITRGDDGRPLSKQQVQISARRVRLEDGKVVGRVSGSHAMAWADENGDFEFKGIEPGAWEVWVFPRVPDLADEKRVFEIVPGGRAVAADFALRVRRLGTLRLRILGSDGRTVTRGVDFTRVEERDGKTWWITLRGKRREDGRWDFALEQGKRRIAAHRSGYRTEPEDISATVEEGEVVEVECRLIRLGSILLTVLDAVGEPVKGFTVRTRRGDGEPRPVHAEAIGNGVHRLRVDPGKTTVLVMRGDTRASPVEVDVKATEASAVTVRLE